MYKYTRELQIYKQMESISVKFLAPAVLAILFLLTITTAPVLGRMPTKTSAEMLVEYKVTVIEEVAKIEPYVDQSGNQQPKIDVLEVQSDKQVAATTAEVVLECQGNKEYCNLLPFVGKKCCSGYICVPLAGVAGGACLRV
ncbi:uncharacterized protein LOC109136088 [Beta vulgaris subsp. vulgaris]|uniref:uncharacterized protein LOC109136088 n=1 Tax=Beta vulgaris subsp. vulgaris TaxID=3555 RepID=UPI002036D8BD|nr:uncharacterized protein LOC109136088 [Beta vulgaris subsp. vulgaris]